MIAAQHSKACSLKQPWQVSNDAYCSAVILTPSWYSQASHHVLAGGVIADGLSVLAKATRGNGLQAQTAAARATGTMNMTLLI